MLHCDKKESVAKMRHYKLTAMYTVNM